MLGSNEQVTACAGGAATRTCRARTPTTTPNAIAFRRAADDRERPDMTRIQQEKSTRVQGIDTRPARPNDIEAPALASRFVGSDPPAALSATELAQRAGVTAEDVQRMVALGLLSSATGGFGPGDVRRVRLAMACERAGLPMDAIAESVGEGRLSFAFMDNAAYKRWAERSERTYADVCREHGVEFEQLRNGLEAMGFEPKGAADHVRTDELEVLPLVALSLQTGVLDEAWMVRIGWCAVSDSKDLDPRRDPADRLPGRCRSDSNA